MPEWVGLRKRPRRLCIHAHACAGPRTCGGERRVPVVQAHEAGGWARFGISNHRAAQPARPTAPFSCTQDVGSPIWHERLPSIFRHLFLQYFNSYFFGASTLSTTLAALYHLTISPPSVSRSTDSLTRVYARARSGDVRLCELRLELEAHEIRGRPCCCCGRHHGGCVGELASLPGRQAFW